MKQDTIISIAVVTLVGILGWIATTLVAVDRKAAVIEERVDQNYRMLEPMWKEFTQGKRNASHDNEPRINEQADQQAAHEEKENPLRKAAWPPESYFTGVR